MLNFAKALLRIFLQSIVKETAVLKQVVFGKRQKKSGLWVRETYDTAMSVALEELTTVESVSDDTGKYLFSVFKLK